MKEDHRSYIRNRKSCELNRGPDWSERGPILWKQQEKKNLRALLKDWVLVYGLSSRRQVAHDVRRHIWSSPQQLRTFEESSNEFSCLKTEKCPRTYHIHITYDLTLSISKYKVFSFLKPNKTVEKYIVELSLYVLCACVYRFRPATVKAIIHDVLNEELSGKQYNSEEATSWSKHISDTVKDKLKGIEFTIRAVFTWLS